MIFFQISAVYQFRGDLNVAIEAASTIPAAFQILLYQTIVRLFRNDIRHVIAGFYHRLANFDLQNTKIRQILSATEERNRRIFLYGNAFCLLAINTVMIIGDKRSSAGLPIITWVPFDLDQGRGLFYSMFTVVMAELYFMAFFNMTFEAFFLIFSLQLHGELQLIEATVQEVDVARDGEAGVRRKLNRIMDLYCDLIGGFKRLVVILGWVALGQFGGGICAISLVLYQFHLSSHSGLMVIVGVVVMVFAISVKMFIASLVATLITDQVR